MQTVYLFDLTSRDEQKNATLTIRADSMTNEFVRWRLWGGKSSENRKGKFAPGKKSLITSKKLSCQGHIFLLMLESGDLFGNLVLPRLINYLKDGVRCENFTAQGHTFEVRYAGKDVFND